MIVLASQGSLLLRSKYGRNVEEEQVEGVLNGFGVNVDIILRMESIDCSRFIVICAKATSYYI